MPTYERRGDGVVAGRGCRAWGEGRAMLAASEGEMNV